MRTTRIAVYAALGLFLPHFAGAQTAIFGPQRFTRGGGPADHFTVTFPQCGTGRQCRVVVVNGNDHRDHRVGNGTISLNGVEVAGAGELRRAAGQIIKPVALKADNRLEVTLASEPESFLTISVECAAAPTALAAGTLTGTLRNGKLVAGLPILNRGTGAARNVTATAITLDGGRLTSPRLPYNLGTIPAGGSPELRAEFDGSFATLPSPVLHVSGTYSAAGASYCFALAGNIALPGPPSGTNMGVTTAAPGTVAGGNYPHQPLNFPEAVNSTSRWKLPEAGPATFRTVPEGLRIAVDSNPPAAAPFTMELAPGAHTIAVATAEAGPAGTRYRFTHWSDGGAASHQISGGNSGVTFTASFTTQHLLEVSVSPPAGGSITVTPASPDGSGYYEAGSKVTLTAQPRPGYQFAGFAGALTGPANPQTVTLTTPSRVVANFRERPR